MKITDIEPVGIRTIDEVLPDAFGPRDLEESGR